MKSLWNGWPMKTFVSALAFLFGGDRLVHALYVPFGVLLLLDLATGLWAARKRQEVSSKVGIRKTLEKFGVYAVIVVAARMLEHILALAVGAPALGYVSVKVAIIYLSTTEAVSIDENLRNISGIGMGALIRRFTQATGVKLNGG